jgi:hypothetical protein
MALYKEVRQEDGVRTSYHRILFLQSTVNQQNSIAVLSYTDEEARMFEQDNEYQPYRQAVTYEVDYDPNMTIEDAYEYLKTLEIFIGAEDV